MRPFPAARRALASLGLLCAALVVPGGALGASGGAPAAGQPAQAAPGSLKLDFETGEAKSTCTAALTGNGGPPDWEIVRDAGAPSGSQVLVEQSQNRAENRFPLCIFDQATVGDGKVSVRLKPVTGRVEQAGGLAVRLKDERNYYLVRASALENNVRLYKVVDGRQTQIGGAGVQVPRNAWHELGVSLQGNRIEVSFEGKPVLTMTDDTFPDAGRVAVWTQSDSVVEFDDLAVAPP